MIILKLPLQSEWISDELLELFITNALNTLTLLAEIETMYIVQTERLCAHLFYQMGRVFKARLSYVSNHTKINYRLILVKKVESIKTGLFDLVKDNGLEAAKVLECYIDLGIRPTNHILILITVLGGAVLGDKFAPEFRQLAKQIVDGTLPFKASAIECYGRFGDLWLNFLELDEERETFVKTMLDAIPESMYEFGQSNVFENQTIEDSQSDSKLPSHLNDFINDYNGADFPEIVFPVRLIPPKHHVPKEYLTPVNPKQLVGEDMDDTIQAVRVITSSKLY